MIPSSTKILVATHLFPGIIRRAGASLLDRTIETTPTRRGRSFVRLAPETIIMVYPSERTYLRQLRILGAWWCLGSSPLVPRVLLLYPPAPLGIFGRLSSGPASTCLVAATHVAPGPTVKNQSAEVSHSPSRIENKRPPTVGSTQGANLVDRTISTLATTAPYSAEPSSE